MDVLNVDSHLSNHRLETFDLTLAFQERLLPSICICLAILHQQKTNHTIRISLCLSVDHSRTLAHLLAACRQFAFTLTQPYIYVSKSILSGDEVFLKG